MEGNDAFVINSENDVDCISDDDEAENCVDNTVISEKKYLSTPLLSNFVLKTSYGFLLFQLFF